MNEDNKQHTQPTSPSSQPNATRTFSASPDDLDRMKPRHPAGRGYYQRRGAGQQSPATPGGAPRAPHHTRSPHSGNRPAYGPARTSTHLGGRRDRPPVPDYAARGTQAAGAAEHITRRPHRHITEQIDDTVKKKSTLPTGPLTTDNIRIIPLGGVEEVGKNMTVLEYKDDIIIIDAGFSFPGEEVPGVDYIIPDITYLVERKERIRGIFVTHGHLDHIGGIPYIMDRIGNPPIYTRMMTSVLIKKRQSEFPHLPALNINVIETNSSVKAGNMTVRFFNVTHTVPDAMGIIIETPYGNCIFAGDLKVDHIDQKVLPEEQAVYDALSKENNLFMMSDSTNTWRPGWSHSEHTIQDNLKEIIKNTPGRLIMATFASLLVRVIFVIKTCEEIGKKVVIDGRGMINSVDIAKELGILKADSKVFIQPEEMEQYPPNKVVVIATGAQGDEYSALMRMSNKTHRKIKIGKGDVVMLSSSIIPGNERRIQTLKDNISRQGSRILDYRLAEIHSSGHANADEAAWVYRMVHPRFFMPCHAGHFMLRMNAELAQSTGIPEENTVIPDNGMIIELQDKAQKLVILKERAASEIVMVDGLGTGGVNEVVIRDRKTLAEDGVFMIVVVIDAKSGKMLRSPDIVSRGLVYLKESQELLRQARLLVRKSVEQSVAGMRPISPDYVKNAIRESIGKYLFQQTHKRPVILPVVIEV